MQKYYDLNLRSNQLDDLNKDPEYLILLTGLINDQYQTVAANYYHANMAIQIPKCSIKPVEKQKLDQLVKKSINLQSEQNPVENFEQLTRITLEINEENNAQLNSYDLVAVRTKDEKVLHSLIFDYEHYDILSLDLNNKDSRFLFKLKRKMIKSLLDKGISIELNYSQSLQDEESRRTIISSCLYISELTRGKNIILSSESFLDVYHRSPQDLAIMGILFGLKRDQAFHSMTSNCFKCVQRSKYRKTFKGIATVAQKSDLELFQQKENILKNTQQQKKDKIIKQKEDKKKIKFTKLNEGNSLNPDYRELIEKRRKVEKVETKKDNLNNLIENPIFLKKSQIDPNNIFENPNKKQNQSRLIQDQIFKYQIQSADKEQFKPLEYDQNDVDCLEANQSTNQNEVIQFVLDSTPN